MKVTQKGYNKGSELSKPRFEILRGLQSGLTITEISKLRKISRMSTYRLINKLLSDGLLEKIDHSYSLTQSGIEGLHSFVGLRYNLRQHNFHIKFKVLESKTNWNQRRNEFRRLPYFNKRIQLKNNEQDLFNFGNLMIKTTTKSIIVKIPTIYAKDINEAIIQTFGILETTVPKIEKLFDVKLIKNYKSCMEIVCQEYALLNDAMARVYSKRGEQLLVKGEDGKVWMITDKSFKGNETEFIHPQGAPEDETEINKALNTLRNDGGMIQRNNDEIVDLKGVYPAMKEYNKNLKLHIKVQQEQLKTQKETQAILKKIGERL